ncbi:MAG: tripartite tricarboxylate transporter substrate binding protein [Burkholderiales bacterium]
MRIVPTLLLCLTASLVAPVAQAQAYPSKPIRMIVPFAPGGGTDILARIIGQGLAEAWGVAVNVENRAGASGNLGTELVARSAPDGHTLVMAINTHAVNATLYSKLPFDPVKDFIPVILAATTANILVVHPSVPANTVQELIALAKSQPGKFNYASGGSGTTSHLAAELFKTMAGVDMVHVPYKGGGAAYTDLIAGQVQLFFVGIPGTLQYIKTGRLRPLGVTTPRRSPAAPDVPTIAEAGLPGFSATTWWGILAPAGTPRPIVDRVDQEVARILKLPDVRAKFDAQGFEPVSSTPESFAAFMKSEIELWGRAVRASGARAE